MLNPALAGRQAVKGEQRPVSARGLGMGGWDHTSIPLQPLPHKITFCTATSEEEPSHKKGTAPYLGQ
ncbi:hypothetical protein GN956_G18358 [Arapaima gigas]